MSGRNRQRREALVQANRAKLRSSALRQQVQAAGPRGGARLAAEAVLDAEAPLTFQQLLCSVPRIGEHTALSMLNRAEIQFNSRVDDRKITARRRDLLAGQLMAIAFGGKR
jgi:hypothetical protein